MNLLTTFASLRKQVAGISIVALVAGLFATGVATAATTNTFADVPANAWFAAPVSNLVNAGIIDSTQTNFRPGDFVNRAEMSKWAFFVSGLPLETATAAPFKDVAMGEWYTNYIYTLSKNGVVSGDKDSNGAPTGTFRPGDNLNRAEASKMLVNAAQMAENLSGAPHFPDVASGAWYYNFVETLYNNGVINGYPDGTFRPGDNINRAEAAKMTDLSMNPASQGFRLQSAAASSKTSVELIFSKDVEKASAENKENYKITDSTGTILAVSAAEQTGSDTVKLTTNSQAENKTYTVTAKDVKNTDGEDLSNNDGVSFLGYGSDVSGGALTVSLSTTTPVAGSVPQGATGVVFTCWDFQAGAEAATVKSLQAHRVGPGSQTAFTNIYLYRGDARLTTGRSINSETQMVEFNNINQKIAAGENAKLCLVGDLAADASGGVHAFEILSAANVLSNSSALTGSFPLRGADQLITTANVGQTTVYKNGVLDELTVGQAGGRIAQFELEADGSEDQMLNRIALYIRGSVNTSDIKNLKLFVEGQTSALASADGVGQKDLVTFTLSSPFKIGRGQKKIFYVTADLAPGRDGDTIKTYLDETTDVFVTGVTYGYGTKVVNNTVGTGYNGAGACPGAGCQASYVLVKGSTFNLAFTGPAAGEVAVGQKAASCLDMTITNGSGSSVEMKNWVVSITSTDDDDNNDATGLYNNETANLSLVKLARVNEDGSVSGSLLGPAELPAFGHDDSANVTLTGSSTINAGEVVKASVIFDVANVPGMENTKVRCTLNNLTTTPDSVRDENGDFLTASSITPSSNIVGNLMTVKASSLTVSTASSPSSTTYSRGTVSAPLLGIQLKAGSALDQRVKTLVITVNATGVAIPKDVLDSGLALYDSATGGTQLSTFKNLSSGSPTATVMFTNLDINVLKNQTKTIYLRGNISNSAVNTNLTAYINASADVIALDQNGQTSTGINVANIAQINAPVMVVSQAGTGTVAQSSTGKTVVAASEKTFEAARFKFTAKDGQATLQDLDFLVTNGNSAAVKEVKLQKLNGSSCEDISGLDAVSPLGSGIVSFNNVGINLSNSSDTILCAIVTTNAVQSSGEPTSGANVGLALLNVSQVDSGSGDNVAPRYAGDLNMDGVGNPAFLFTALDSVAAPTLDMNGPLIVNGSVLLIGDEMILVTNSTDADVSGTEYRPTGVIRGFAGTTAGSHPAGSEISLSTVTKAVASLTDIKKGDVYSNGNRYMLALKDNPTNLADRVILPFGANVDLAPAVGQVRFPLHGTLSKLFRSVPVVTLESLPSNSLSATTVVSKFTITPENSSVTFKKDATKELIISFAASNATINGESCTLREFGGSDVDTTTAGAGVIEFDFSDQATDYVISGARTFEVQCNVTSISTPASVATQFIGAADPVKWFDGNIDVAGVGTALFPSATSPQTTSSN